MKAAKVLKVVIVIMLILLVGAGLGGGFYLRNQFGKTTYFENTKINGRDVGDKTPQQVLSELAEDYSDITVQINEAGEPSITGMLEEFGYVVDQSKLMASLDDTFERQKSNVLDLVASLIYGNSFTVTIPFTFYQDKLDAKVNAQALKAERVSSVNAEMKYDSKKKEYYIQPEVNGNEFEDSQFQDYVRGELNTYVSGNHPNSTCTIDFPEEIYVRPEITDQDVEMNTKVNVYNQFCKAKVTYLFGSEKQMIDWNTIQDWLYIENGEGFLSDEKMYEYIQETARKYDTRHYDRTFRTSYGTDVLIPASENDYGYTINEDEEFRQLVADIRSNTPVEREPIYYRTAGDYGNPVYYQRDGRDDLAGTYVEVNLSTQHLWFYKDYGLIVESDIVSGSVARGSETKTGVFPLAYKESPSVLVGADAANGYRTEVTYWMPFYDGQGLHDAKWRYSFGGNIYITNGSHGCVNLPYSAAEAIYYYIDAGMPIVIYK